jgi:hypothetical protein
MTTEQKVIKNKVGLLKLAKELVCLGQMHIIVFDKLNYFVFKLFQRMQNHLANHFFTKTN